MGLTFSDPEAISSSKSVTLCCVALTLIFILTSTIEVIVGHRLLPALLGLASSLGAPAFGWLGARRGSATFMSVFVALMIVNAVISVMFVLAIIVIGPNKEWGGIVYLYLALWVAGGGLSIIAARSGQGLLKKLMQGEKVVDAEAVEDDIDAQLPTFSLDGAVGRKRIFEKGGIEMTSKD